MTAAGRKRDSARPADGGDGRYSREEIEQADGQLARAFAILGLTTAEGTLVCPVCGTGKRGKVQIKTSSTSGRQYWTCHRCPDTSGDDGTRPWGGSAIDLLREHGGRDFPTAIGQLIGRLPVPEGVGNVERRIAVSDAFRAEVDVEVYDHIRGAGSVEEAIAYYEQWHILPGAVEEAGVTLITDADALQAELTERYGLERLVACGVVTADKDGRPVFLFSRDYPVVEPHEAPSGHVVGMQFRPSRQRLKAVAAHKAWKRRWSGIAGEDGVELDPSDAWREAYTADPTVGRREPYVTPFLSLRGGGPDHLVGGGLRRLAALKPGREVYVVEGIKDLMAANTLGVEAYAIPGASTLPPAHAIEILRRHRIHVLLDGDEAGGTGRENLTAHLKAAGVDARAADLLRDGMDVADTVVEREAHRGCTCDTCTAWIGTHPWDPDTCPCRVCRRNRQH